MVNVLFFVAAAAVFLHVQWAKRRGHYDPVVLLRDAGLALAALYVLIEGSNFLINLAWWGELGQTPTFWTLIRIEWLPRTAAALAGMAVLITAFRLGRRRNTNPLSQTRIFNWLGHLAAILLAIFMAVSLIDPWTIALWLGNHAAGVYRDPLFGRSLGFYMFRLPFYEMLLGWAGFVLVLGLLLYGATLAMHASAERMRDLRERLEAQARGYAMPPRVMDASRLPDFSGLLRLGAALLLALFAINAFFNRFQLLFHSHRFLYGADFVDVRFGLPLLWVQIVAALGLALLLLLVRGGHGPRGWLGVRPVWLAPVAGGVFVLTLIVPPLVETAVRSIYVSPNEMTLERPYIVNHIQATRMAYAIQQNSREKRFVPADEQAVNLANYPDTADNIRLWDWRPFQDNITQLQALRPYYDFPDVDVDRYRIQGQKRQVLIAARSLNTSLLPQSAQTWVNLHLQYTHGYGAVAGLVNQASQEGEPRLILKNAPAETSIARFRLTQPEIYYGEQTDDWVFVDTSQPEFNYPKGEENAYNTYHGSGGFKIGGMMRLAAAIYENDTNVLLTSYLTPNSKMLLHRQIMRRVKRLAPFLHFDPDPYLVINRQGRLFWMLDAYTTSNRHPYSEPMDFNGRQINYIRNSVKVTVDAYNGTVHFYVFDPRDPVLEAYRSVFPQLFLPRSAMPKDLLRHIRYPELLFDAQAQIYRLYHMTDPQVFYNKEDQWDIAKQVVQQGQTEITHPYYVMMQLPRRQNGKPAAVPAAPLKPGGTKTAVSTATPPLAPHAEFVLMLPFTSHHRDNLIAWVAARCDPRHYGQILFYRLPKEKLVYGPLQIESRIDQNRRISKDLSLWNQQGSRVIRGTTLVLPVDHTFVYIEPIYIQATQARLPELKKVVLAVGNRLVYSDNLPEGMALLAQAGPTAAGAAMQTMTTSAAAPAPEIITGMVPASVLESIAGHLRQYQQDTAQGQMAQAGQQLQAIVNETRQALAARKPMKK